MEGAVQFIPLIIFIVIVIYFIVSFVKNRKYIKKNIVKSGASQNENEMNPTFYNLGKSLKSSKILIYAVILIVGIAIGSNLISNNQSGNGERVRQLENKVKYLERNQTSAEKNARKIQAIRDCLMADLDTLMCAGVD